MTPAAPTQPKTLPHALARSAQSSANLVGGQERLGQGLDDYAKTWEKIGAARLEQDDAITAQFIGPWQTTLSNSIGLALKARQAVRVSRLELDAAKQA